MLPCVLVSALLFLCEKKRKIDACFHNGNLFLILYNFRRTFKKINLSVNGNLWMFKLFISDGEEAQGARRSDCVYLTHNLLIVNCEGK